jgi:hypothetical protein
MKSKRAVVEMMPAATELNLAPLIRAMLDQLADDPQLRVLKNVGVMANAGRRRYPAIPAVGEMRAIMI